MRQLSKKYLQMKLAGKPVKTGGTAFLKYIRFVFLGCFVIGIIYANILGEEKLTSFGILNEYFIEKFKFASIRKENLFFYILEERLPIMVLMLILVFTSFRLAAGSVFIGWQGFSAGFLLSTALIKYGMKGLVLIGGAAFPQYLIYIPIYIIYLHLASHLQHKIYCFKVEGQQSYNKSKVYAASLLVVSLIFCAFVTGIFLESYVNPPLLKKVLKIF